MRLLLNALVGFAESFEQTLLRSALLRAGVGLLNRFYRDVAGNLAAFVASHAVGNDRQAAQALEAGIVFRLPVAVAVFVVVALAAHIAQAGNLNTRAHLHNDSVHSL